MKLTKLLLTVAIVAAAAAVVDEAFAQTEEQIATAVAAYSAPWIAQSFAFGSIMMWVVVACTTVAVGAITFTYVSRWVASSGLNQSSLMERIRSLGGKGDTKIDESKSTASAGG